MVSPLSQALCGRRGPQCTGQDSQQGSGPRGLQPGHWQPGDLAWPPPSLGQGQAHSEAKVIPGGHDPRLGTRLVSVAADGGGRSQPRGPCWGPMSVAPSIRNHGKASGFRPQPCPDTQCGFRQDVHPLRGHYPNGQLSRTRSGPSSPGAEAERRTGQGRAPRGRSELRRAAARQPARPDTHTAPHAWPRAPLSPTMASLAMGRPGRKEGTGEAVSGEGAAVDICSQHRPQLGSGSATWVGQGLGTGRAHDEAANSAGCADRCSLDRGRQNQEVSVVL